MNKDSLACQLCHEIKKELGKVTRVNSPNIWNAIRFRDGRINPAGYKAIGEKLVHKIIEGQLVPAAAIPQLEEEMDFT